MSKPSRGSRRASGASGVDEFVTALLTASRVLVGISAASLADIEETVTLTQFRTLVVLDNSGDINLNGLAEVLGVNASTAMRTIDRLLAAGLVSRTENPANRREVMLRLTSAGAELVGRVTDRRRAELTKIVRKMPAAQRAELVAALTEFADAAGEPVASGSVSAFGW